MKFIEFATEDKGIVALPEAKVILHQFPTQVGMTYMISGYKVEERVWDSVYDQLDVISAGPYFIEEENENN